MNKISSGRNRSLVLTKSDKQAAKAAPLGSQAVRDGLWILAAVVRSHYVDGVVNADRMYRAGNAVGDWLDLNGWVGIAIMQEPANKDEFASLIQRAV